MAGTQGYRVGPTGHANAVDERLDDFEVGALGFLVRYRYELAPLSYLYIAYMRGGDAFNERIEGESVRDTFSAAFDMRDSEQFLMKLSYRFEI